MEYTKEDCLSALEDAKNKLGESPTMAEYRKLEGLPSVDTILRRFDTWNDAKKEAGLETFGQNNEISQKPEEVEIPQNKKWEELSSYQRYYYRNRRAEKNRSKMRKKKLKKWFKKIKRDLQCERCGEDHPACLDFHHEGEKEYGVAELVNKKRASRERIRQEIDKCEVLCANCHRKHHSTSPLV